MSWPETQLDHAELEHYTPFSPFESSYAFEPEVVDLRAEASPMAAVSSPFLAEYAGEPAGRGRDAQELGDLLFELYDREFEEHLADLAQEAAAVAADRVGILGEADATAPAERFLDEWARPMRERADAMLEGVAEALEHTDPSSLSESELDAIFERFEPRDSGLERSFENFLGGLLKKAKKVVGGAVKLAKKGVATAVRAIPGLSGLLKRLKLMVKPLLDRVLRTALDRLPPGLRAPAQTLAQRVLGTTGAAAPAESQGEPAAVPELYVLQQELDLRVASLLFAADDAEQEVVVNDAITEREDPAAPIGQLLEARADFVDELARGADPAEAMERFIPAVMAVLPVARTVIGVVGRPKVVGFLARHLAKLVEPHVGPQAAPALSQAIVETGLRLLTLEAPTDDQTRRLAPAAIAGTVEDTVRRVAELDEETLEQSALLEAAVNEAFSEAVSENFPPRLLVPEVREAAEAGGTWVSMPLTGRRKYYRKYTRIIDLDLTAQKAAAVTTFGGGTLAAFLKAQLGVTPPVRVRAHLYQAIPGTWLSRIARHEKGVAGLGSAAKSAWSQLHPLTPEAAGMLLGEPGLGRRIAPRFTASRDLIGVGQRFYYLEIAGARVPPPADTARPAIRRTSEVNLTLDFPADEFRVSVYLSEADAQELATRLRRKEISAASMLAKKAYGAALRTAMEGDLPGHVRIRHETTTPEQFAAAAGRLITHVGKGALQALGAKLVDWVGRAIATYLQEKATEAIAATEDPADGVTIVVTVANVPGAGVVRRLLSGEGLGTPLPNPLSLFEGAPRLSVRTLPGFHFA